VAQLPFITLLLLISFASVNAILFTPGLPDITNFFGISQGEAQQTITWFLVGYALGQLVYGPVANRFGRKPALYAGIGLQIVSSLLCVFAGTLQDYAVLVFGRFMLALGAGVGLKMTFTLVSECYEPRVAAKKISYLMLAFAITPGIAVAVGGILNEAWGWQSCFYAGAVYGVILLLLTIRLPETYKVLDYEAFKISHLLQAYGAQFRNVSLVAGGMLMGGATCFVYVFAAVAPFIAIQLLGMSSSEYGTANLLPPLGLMLGSLLSARFADRYPFSLTIRVGMGITIIGTLWMFIASIMHFAALYSIFLPMVALYFGLALMMSNASTLAMSQVIDKAHGSAVMNFINMGLATMVVLCVGFFPMSILLLPLIFMVLCVGMIGICYFMVRP
jgi:predicted MFS family arabinose efflux permease